MEIILKPVYVTVIVQDGQAETPHDKRVWQATFRRESTESNLEVYGDTQEAAIASLLQKTGWLH